ncbi:MAG: nucleotidyltransferase domain-containing protein [Chloroflexi bacterium]|nr:nucleotidyltransferase domain-containing protein [Chloroflexota bacterium]
MVTTRTHPIEPYLSYWRQRMAAEQARNRRLAERARADAQRIAAMLRHEFGVTRVLLFGSLVKGGFSADSDIDLAVAGLAPDAFFTALARAGQLTEFPVDIKPLEALESHFKHRVLEMAEEI